MEVKIFIEKLSKINEKNVLLDFLSHYRKFSSEQKEEIRKLFKKEKDGKYYIAFLEKGGEKIDYVEKEKLCALLLSRKTFGIPYDEKKVRKVIEIETEDLEALRNNIYEAIKETYNPALDKICSEKISQKAREEGKRIVCGRFSRAFYIDALLLANAKLIPSNIILPFIKNIKNKCGGIEFNSSYIMGEIQHLENLTLKKEISIAQIKGGLKKLKDTLRDYELQLIQKFEEDEIKIDFKKIRELLDQVRFSIKKFEKQISKTPGKPPVYMVFFQRIFPIDAIYMGLLNELRDPFLGDDPKIQKLLAGGGENIYITPDMKDWLKKCDDWIEALPAYASYQIIPQNGSYKFKAYVQRNILEEIYRANAESWALNIEEVMLTENISIAREIFAKNSKPSFKNEIVYLAALVEKTSENLISEIGKKCEKEKVLRYDGLKKIIVENTGKKNLVYEFSRICNSKKSLKTQLENFVKKYKIVNKVDKYLLIINQLRRKPPSAHILTTLGPGESEFNVKNWLEEGMLLFNVIRNFGLQKKVEKRIELWKTNLIKIGEKIIRENKLEGEVYKLGEGKKRKEDGILKVIFAYPEIGKELTTVALLLDKEGKNINKSNFKPEEPEKVIELLKGKKRKLLKNLKEGQLEEDEVIILKQIREKVIKKYKLEKELAAFLKNYLNPTYAKLNARRQIIVEENLLKELSNPLFRYEATGPFKRYNLLYTPSRVDLGAKEVHSVRDIPKWVGGVDEFSAMSGKNLYQLHNIAGPTVIPSTRIAEFLKVGENFFSRGGVYYLSLTASINLDALRIGDFEFFRNQWNMRGDRTVLPAGETYGGFCVPKEFNLLYAIIIACVDKEISSQILRSFGIPEKIQEKVKEDLRKALSWKADFEFEVDWEAKASSYLYTKYPEYFKIIGKPTYISRLPQIAKTLEKMGIISIEDSEERNIEFQFTCWVNKKAQGFEEINRTGPFRKVKLIYDLVRESGRKNPEVAPDTDLTGVMTANYKEGELENGRLIPVSDVRFSAGSRKLEIYSKVAENHLLLDIDPEGREIIKKMFKNFVSPADIRIVGRCTGSDILNHVPNSGLEEIKNKVEDYLFANTELDENLINTNCIVYGGDLKNWIGIRDIPVKKRENVIKNIEGKIHLLVVDKRGPFFSYEEAIQGVDFIDLGIPDPELLDLVDNLPKLIYLMKKGRPFSALVFADGTSGARRPTFAFRQPNCRKKVKELFAVEENAVYGCLGIGKGTIENWRNQMEEERNLSKRLLEAILGEDKKRTKELLIKIQRNIILNNKIDEVIREESEAKRINVWSLKNRFISDTFSNLAQFPSPERFDFGKWVISGGMYLLNGKYEPKEIEELKNRFETKLKNMTEGKNNYCYSGEEIDFIIKGFIRPAYIPSREEQYREITTGLAGSLKAVEEKASRLAQWEERKKEFNRIVALRERNDGFKSIGSEKLQKKPLSFIYTESKKIIGNGLKELSPYNFGEFLRISKVYLESLNKKIISYSGGNLSIYIEKVFSGEEILEEDYLSIVTRLAESAELKAGNKKFYEEIAGGLELTDIAFLLEKISNCYTEEEYNSEIAKFFDRTVNSHIFDYFPYHYHKERSAAFEKLDRDEKFEFAEKYHRWLYTYLRYLITEKSPLKNLSGKYINLYIGNIDKNISAIGVKGKTKEELFWFHYARLRDTVVLKYEGFGYPEIFTGIKPEDLKIEKRTNVGIIYPYGNTTVPVALEQGPELAEKAKTNLILCAFPVTSYQNGNKILTVQEGLFYPAQKDLNELRKKHTSIGENKTGIVLATFKEPLILHGLFFHFTHPLRPEVDSFKIPVIQPLIWEGATHLKCELPGMLKGSGVKIPEQENWYMEDTEKLEGKKAKEKIKTGIRKLAKTYNTVIVKPEKESGGRKSLILPVREGNKYINENIDQLAELAYEISKNDNAVIQQVLKSRVRQLYSEKFLNNTVERFAKIGIPVLLDREPQTPLYSYFRQILVLGKKGYEISHHITVVSTRGIANVGQGGLLYEYTDDIINPKYRKDMREQITLAAYNSMEFQRKYLRKNWKKVIQEYLKIYPEFAERVKYTNIFADLTGFSINDIPYEMGDYMPVFLVDEDDNLKYVFNPENEKMLPLYDEKGKPTDVKIYDEHKQEIQRVDKNGDIINIPLFDKKDRKRKIYDKNGKQIPSLIIYKIEANPGAGLWRPHNDQLPDKRKGEGVFTIFNCLAQRAGLYKSRLLQKHQIF